MTPDQLEELNQLHKAYKDLKSQLDTLKRSSEDTYRIAVEPDWQMEEALISFAATKEDLLILLDAQLANYRERLAHLGLTV